MAYDPEKVEILKKYDVMSTDKMRISVCIQSYNGAPPKISIPREVFRVRSGVWVFARLGSVTAEEAIAIAPVLKEASTYLLSITPEKKEAAKVTKTVAAPKKTITEAAAPKKKKKKKKKKKTAEAPANAIHLTKDSDNYLFVTESKKPTLKHGCTWADAEKLKSLGFVWDDGVWYAEKNRTFDRRFGKFCRLASMTVKITKK